MPRAAPRNYIAAEGQQLTFGNQQLLISNKRRVSFQGADRADPGKRVRAVNGIWVKAVNGTPSYFWYRES